MSADLGATHPAASPSLLNGVVARGRSSTEHHARLQLHHLFHPTLVLECQRQADRKRDPGRSPAWAPPVCRRDPHPSCRNRLQPQARFLSPRIARCQPGTNGKWLHALCCNKVLAVAHTTAYRFPLLERRAIEKGNDTKCPLQI